MPSPRTTHVASSAAYIVLAMTAAGVVLVPRGVLPDIGPSSPALEALAQQTPGSSPGTSASDGSDTDGSGAGYAASAPAYDFQALLIFTDAASAPNPADPDVTAPSPAALPCASDCHLAALLAAFILPGFPGVASNPPVEALTAPPADGLPPGDETVAIPLPTDEPAVGTTGDPGATPPVPADPPAEEPTQPPTDPGVTPDPTPEPTPDPPPDPPPAPNPDATPAPTGVADSVPPELPADPPAAGN